MSGNIFGSLVDSVKEVFSNPQVLAQGVKDGNIARTGNTEYFIDGKDSFHNIKDAEAASGRWQKRAQDELIGLATIGIGKQHKVYTKGLRQQIQLIKEYTQEERHNLYQECQNLYQ